MAFVRNSEFTPLFRWQTAKLLENGVIDMITRTTIPQTVEPCPTLARPVAVENTISAFVLLLIGMLVGSAVAFAECIVKSWRHFE